MKETTFFYSSIANYYDYIFPVQVAQVDFCHSLLGELHGKSIIDIGCATGNLAIKLAEAGAGSVTGIDPDTDMIRCTSCKTESDNVQFCTADTNNIPVENETQDLATCFGNTIAHIEECELLDFFRNIRTSLKNNGKLAVQLLNYNHILEKEINILPEINNKYIRFDRNYNLAKAPSSIQFNTRLLVKSKHQYIDNSITLYPHSKELIINTIKQAGFSCISTYGNFKMERDTGNQLQLVITAIKK